MAKQSCAGGCGSLVQRGCCEVCAGKHAPRSTALAIPGRSPAQKIYSSVVWQKARAGYLAKHPVCVDPKRKHVNRLLMATNVDHIIPHGNDFSPRGLFWNSSNWQPLCQSCHSHKTSTEDGGFGREPIPRRR